MLRQTPRRPGSLRQPAARAALRDMVRNETCPASLVRCTETTTIVAVEVLVEPNIVTEVRVRVEADVPAVERATAVHVAPEDVDDAVLDLFCDFEQVHVVARASRAFDLQLFAVVLVEAL